jgi:hypothetical protein
VKDVGKGGEQQNIGDGPYLAGLRAAEWFDFALAIVAALVVGCAMNKTGILGGKAH